MARSVTVGGVDVLLTYRKYDGRLHWNATLRYLGEDDHGVWLAATPEVVWRRGEEPAHFNFPHTVLVPRGAWFVAAFNGLPADLEMYIDVTTVPLWTSPDEVTAVDLDLDVVRWRDTGRVEI